MPISLAAILVFLALSPSWSRFPAVWAANREHGFAIVVLCGWLLWRDRHQLTRCDAPVPLAVGGLVVASVAWWMALVAGIQVGHLILTPVILLLWLAATAGQGAVRAALPATATFSLAIPVWEVLVPLLQWITVLVNQSILKLTGIKAQIRDTFIVLESGVLEVADSCSGLNFLMVGTTVGVAYALLFIRERRLRWRIVGLAVALSLLANWLRVLGLVIIADRTAMQSPLMEDHEVYGWSVFVVALLLFFVLAKRIEKSATVPESNTATSPSPSPSLVTATPRTMWPTLAVLVGPALLLALVLFPAPATPPAENPGIVAGEQWVPIAANTAPTPAKGTGAVFLGASSHVVQAMAAGAAVVRLDRYQYTRQEEGAELVSAANRLAADTVIVGSSMVGPLDQSLRMVRETAVRDGANIRLIWSWYRVAGIETPSATKAKLLQLAGAVQRRADAEAVLVSAQCQGTQCEQARAALFLFVAGRDIRAERDAERAREAARAGSPAGVSLPGPLRQ